MSYCETLTNKSITSKLLASLSLRGQVDVNHLYMSNPVSHSSTLEKSISINQKMKKKGWICKNCLEFLLIKSTLFMKTRVWRTL